MTHRHRRRLATYFLLGLSLLQCVRCLPEEIKIGALFGIGDEEAAVENALIYAVYRVNHEPDLLPNTRLSFNITKLPIDDGFRASKKVCHLVEWSAIAMFGPRNPILAGFVNSLCGSIQVPHIEFRMDSGIDTHPTLSVNLYPQMDQLSKAFMDLIRKYDWNQMLVIYSSTTDLLKVQRIIRGSFKPTFDIMVRQVDQTNMRYVLKEAKAKKWTNMLVDLDLNYTSLLLKMALQEGMIDPYHHYILTSMDVESIDMENYRYNYVNLTGFRLIDYETLYVQQIMKAMEVYEIQTNKVMLNKSGYITLPHEAALLFDAVHLLAYALDAYEKDAILRPVNTSCDRPSPWSSGPSLYSYLTKVSVPGLTGNIHLHQGRRFDFTLNILQLKTAGLEKVGMWDVNTGINFTYKQGFGDGSPFGNKTLTVTTIQEKPYMMPRESPDENGQMYEGFCVDLLKELSRIVGFRYRIRLVPDGNYGAPNDDGVWNGMVGQIIERKADLAVAPLTINYVREQVIDFTKPFLNLGITILFKVPKREKPGLFSFLNPLAIEIWLYVIAAYLLVSFTIFILARFSPYEWYNPHPCNPEADTVENTFNLSNSFWFTVGTLMQQGSDVNPKAVSTRIVGSIWWFFTLIIISSYTANLAAFLTVERMVSPIESAEDVAKQTEIAYGTLKSGSTMQFFRDSNIDTYKRMWAFMKDKEPSVFASTYVDGIKRVKQGGYAFLSESTMIDYITQRDCELMQVGGLLDSKGYGIGTPINSPYRDKLSMAILELQENGRIQMLYNKWWKGADTCVRDENKDSKASALGVENVGGIFVVLLVGLALAVFVAICEFVWKSKKDAREDKESVCVEMAEELRFAIRCLGSTQKPRFKRNCSKCKSKRHSQCGDVPDSVNGIIQLTEVRKSPLRCSKEFESEFRPEYSQARDFNGDYLHVEYSDVET
ncbi:glutamate receptor ionotropic, kainate 2-like [Gigantopelta aegis]|uniref:glutamate receptor ionotropic, kainate 2-like n=1 Tax=Gigantopelta aegis TaxID=1735272 RepID=UPI001B88B028|nr:glutamate receptor ionotropic, kainate 2-like [Gigantopelta aegis]